MRRLVSESAWCLRLFLNDLFEHWMSDGLVFLLLLYSCLWLYFQIIFFEGQLWWSWDGLQVGSLNVWIYREDNSHNGYLSLPSASKFEIDLELIRRVQGYPDFEIRFLIEDERMWACLSCLEGAWRRGTARQEQTTVEKGIPLYRHRKT